jgi:hypothetical protein
VEHFDGRMELIHWGRTSAREPLVEQVPAARRSESKEADLVA